MINNRIKTVRNFLKLSQRAFGEKLGLSRDVISNIEYGRVKPKKLFLDHMCQQYKVNRHWLETGEGNMFDEISDSEDKFQEALSIFQTLRPEFQNYALEQIKGLVKLQDQMNQDKT